MEISLLAPPSNHSGSPVVDQELRILTPVNELVRGQSISSFFKEGKAKRVEATLNRPCNKGSCIKLLDKIRVALALEAHI